VVGRLETFAAKVYNGLQQADFQTRRAIIRSLVKRVDVEQQHIRIVFRVSPTSVPPSLARIIHKIAVSLYKSLFYNEHAENRLCND
jgi:hypothetical protein